MNNEEKAKDNSNASSKLEVHFQKPYELPCILQASGKDVMINKNDPNELQCLNPCFHKVMIKTDKLIFKSYGDWDVNVYTIPSEYFSSREEFDNLIIKEDRRKHLNPGKSFKTISIQEAFKQLNTKIKVNMNHFFRAENKNEYDKFVGGDYDIEYYQWCWNEMKRIKAKSKKDKSSEQYIHLKNQIKKIKSILLYKLMAGIFGENDESNENENIYNLKDFCLLCYDGNFRYATAKNGKIYLGFIYGTS